MDRPHTEEYAEYYQQYIDSVPGSDVLQVLAPAFFSQEGIVKLIPQIRRVICRDSRAATV